MESFYFLAGRLAAWALVRESRSSEGRGAGTQQAAGGQPARSPRVEDGALAPRAVRLALLCTQAGVAASDERPCTMHPRQVHSQLHRMPPLWRSSHSPAAALCTRLPESRPYSLIKRRRANSA